MHPYEKGWGTKEISKLKKENQKSHESYEVNSNKLNLASIDALWDGISQISRDYLDERSVELRDEHFAKFFHSSNAFLQRFMT